MRSILAVGLLLATAGIGLAAKAVDMVGVTTMTIDVPDGDRALHVTLWYPAKAGGTSVRVGDSPVFESVEGKGDAPIADGPSPLILVSHGGIRAAPSHRNWVGSRLAASWSPWCGVRRWVRAMRISPCTRSGGVLPTSAALSALENDP